MMIMSYDQRWWWDYYDWVFRINKLEMMTTILKYVCDWFNQHWVNIRTFHLRFIQIYLKLSFLMENYLTEQEKYKFHYLKSNPLMWNYLAEQKKRIAFMLLIVELSPKGRNPNITPQTRTPWKKWRIILVVVYKNTFMDWVVWFLNYGTIICVIFRVGGLKINLKEYLRKYSPHT
jgi:hypothetical protein